MARSAPVTEQKLLRALMQFKRLGFHHQPISGCKPSELRVLFCIKKSRNSNLVEVKVSDISKQLHVTSPTVTQILKGLEARELIERRVDPIDRRAVGITLTEEGEQVAQQAMDAFSDAMHGLVEYLGEEQSDQLADLLSRVYRYFEEQNAQMSDSFWNGDDHL